MIPLLPGPDLLPRLAELLPEDQEYAALRPITPEVVAQVCRLGYLPMGLGEVYPDILLIKCHRQRMVLDLSDLHVPRNVRRYARGLTVSVDQQFASTLTEIDRYHADSWISPSLAAAFQVLHERPIHGVRLHSVEVDDPDALKGTAPVAAEIGYTVGGVYTSLSGYHTRNGSGWVQMVGLGRILQQRSAAFWDLGMDLSYKRRLGALPVGRREFIQRYRTAAGTTTPPIGASGSDELAATAGAKTDAATVPNLGSAADLLRPTGPVPAYELVTGSPSAHHGNGTP
ncbi:MAG: hypothetical protein R6U25_13450 [Alkalispirochaeta sp.]